MPLNIMNRILRPILCALMLLTGNVGVTAGPQRLYVSPSGSDHNDGSSPTTALQTLEGARNAVRSLKAHNELNGPLEVIFATGTYPISRTVVFTTEDSGTPEAPITYRSEQEGQALLSGGIAVTGWKKHKNGIWVTTLPLVKEGKWWFRQLYVNGQWRGRARTPNQGVLEVKATTDTTTSLRSYQVPSDSFIFAPGDIDPTWEHPENGEAIIYHYWTDTHLPIWDIDASQNRISFGYPSGKVFRDGFEGDLARYVIENVYETLDQPGEWVLERATGRLFYMPMPGEDMNRIEVIAPATQTLISIEGDPLEGEWVENLAFEGLQFAYSNFELPWGDCNNDQGSASVAACIDLRGARGCSFEGCTLRNLGTFGFELFEGCTSNHLCYNTLEELAAGGIRIRGAVAGGNPALRTGDNTISDNTIAHYGLTYPSGVGILVMHSDRNTITHNLIHHGDYTGISVGWSWGYLRSAARGNLIEKNHIHDIGYNNLLSDMGGIYTLGLSPGTTVRGNLVHDVNANRYGGWGIYADEGSTSILVENNIVYHTKFGTFNIHYAKDLVVRNNIFALGRLQQYSRSKREPHTTVYFEGNILYWTQGRLLVDEYEWKDEPYSLHVNPYLPPRDTTVTYVSDWNLFYNPNQSKSEADFSGRSWEEWLAEGKDRHSIYADPMFVDPEHFDFRLQPDSPAFKLGFQPIDTRDVGPRPRNNTPAR